MITLVIIALITPLLSIGADARVNEDVLMNIPSVTASPGEDVTVSFEVLGSLSAFTIDITYDADDLVLRSYDNMSGLAVSTDIAGKIKVIWSDELDKTFAGEILSATFAVDVSASGVYEFSMSCDDARWVNGNEEGSLEPAVGSLTIPGGTAPEETILKASSASGKVGDIVTINVSIENNPGILGSVLEVTYDDAVLEVLSAEAGNVSSSGLFFANTEEPGKVKMSWLPNAGVYSNGSMMEIEFKIKETAEGSTSISVQDNGTADLRMKLISTKTVDGTVSINDAASGPDKGTPSQSLLVPIAASVAVIAAIGATIAWFRIKKRTKEE